MIYFIKAQDIYDYISSYRDEGLADGSHPASLVLEVLTEGDVNLRCQQLDQWYQDYAAYRQMPYLHRAAGSIDTWL